MKTYESGLNASETQSRRMQAAAAIILMTALVGVALAGCSNKSESSGNLASPAKEQQAPAPNKPPAPPAPVIGQQETAPAATSVMEPAMTAWRQGDKSLAVSRFVEANWSARPLFAPGSTLSLSEGQFQSLPAAERNAKANDLLNQVGDLKQLARAVAQAGSDAAVQNNYAQARKYYNSLKQCGEALDGPDSMLLVSQVGKALKKMADEESAKLGQ